MFGKEVKEAAEHGSLVSELSQRPRQQGQQPAQREAKTIISAFAWGCAGFLLGISSYITFAFRCKHNWTRPFAKLDFKHRPIQPPTHYVVCVECGEERLYDWNKMKMQNKTGGKK